MTPTPLTPAEHAETLLINAILNGDYPIDSTLPAERDLATQLGVTRPTLREALQRLARDGWLDIRHGKPTRVRNYWQEGNLAVLAAIAARQTQLPADFVANLLTVRTLLAPTYTRLAVERAAPDLASLLEPFLDLPDQAEVYAAADWHVHHQMTILSGNPVFTLIFNGFHALYLDMSRRYFAHPAARAHSHAFYAALRACALARDANAAETLCRRVMMESGEAASRETRDEIRETRIEKRKP